MPKLTKQQQRRKTMMPEDFLSFKKDPTKTVAIRRRWMAQFNVRYRVLAGKITRLLTEGKQGGIKVPVARTSTLETNAFKFTSDAKSVSEFMGWLNLQIESTIFSNRKTAVDQWQNKFIDQAYIRGIRKTHAEFRRLGITGTKLEELKSTRSMCRSQRKSFSYGTET